MARLPTLKQSQMDDRQKQVYSVISAGPRGNVRGPLAVWLHRVDLADKAQALGQYCRYNSSLAPRLSELAILTTARIWDATFSGRHICLLRWLPVLTPLLLTHCQPTSIRFLQLRMRRWYMSSPWIKHQARCIWWALWASNFDLGKDGTVDLVGILGYYALISMTIKAFDVDPLTIEKVEQ